MLNVPVNTLDVSRSMSSGDWENQPSILRRWGLKQLEGGLLTLVETLGFDEKREQAVKSLVRKEVWKFWEEETMHEDVFHPELSKYIEDMFTKYYQDHPDLRYATQSSSPHRGSTKKVRK